MFNPEKHIASMQPAVNKLAAYLKSKGIEFSPNGGDNNVLLTSKNKVIKISNHSFYRFSGIAVTYKEIDKNTFEVNEITDEMYLNNYMKPIIETLFK